MRTHDQIPGRFHTACLALVAASASPALAQTSEPEAQRVQLNEVVVTASKLGSTSAQDTPISLTALDAEQLARASMSDLRDVVTATPSLVIGENSGLAQVYIRGIGTNNVFAGGDPSTTVHIDGVYQARAQGTFNNFLDVERIEVLRGPQGTLYGRNSVGGTINIISRQPSLTRLSSDAQLSLGNQNLRRLEGQLSGPLVEDRLAVGIAAQASQRDGWRENISTGGDLDDEDSRAARAQLRWEPSQGVKVALRADYFRNESAIYDFDTFIEPPTTPLTAQIFGDFSRIATNFPNRLRQESWGTSAEVLVDLSANWVLRSLTAYRANDFDVAVDSDGSELDLLHSLFTENQSQVSQEFNLTRRTDALDLLLGAFYLDEDIDMSDTLGVQVIPAGIAARPAPRVETTSWALFGQGTWHMSDLAALTLGVRYTEEDKQFDQNYGLFTLADYSLIANLGFPVETGHYSKLTPKVGIEITPNDNTLLYASAARGFKSGGFSFTAPAPGGYRPESLWAYELGAKTDFLDRRLRLNGALFYYDYQDLQVLAFVVPGSIDVTNATTASLYGAELELEARLTTSFAMRLGLSYLDAEYDDFPEAPGPGGVTIDASGNRLNNAPQWMLQAGFDYRHDFSHGSLYAAAHYAWQDNVFFTADNNAVDSQSDYGLVDATIGIASADERWDVALWGRNLTDEDYVTWSVQYTPPGRAGHAGAPRSYGLRVKWKY